MSHFYQYVIHSNSKINCESKRLGKRFRIIQYIEKKKQRTGAIFIRCDMKHSWFTVNVNALLTAFASNFRMKKKKLFNIACCKSFFFYLREFYNHITLSIRNTFQIGSILWIFRTLRRTLLANDLILIMLFKQFPIRFWFNELFHWSIQVKRKFNAIFNAVTLPIV